MPNLLKNGRHLPPPEQIQTWGAVLALGSEGAARFAQEHPKQTESLRTAFYSTRVAPGQALPPSPFAPNVNPTTEKKG